MLSAISYCNSGLVIKIDISIDDSIDKKQLHEYLMDTDVVLDFDIKKDCVTVEFVNGFSCWRDLRNYALHNKRYNKTWSLEQLWAVYDAYYKSGTSYIKLSDYCDNKIIRNIIDDAIISNVQEISLKKS